jgi:hypothetical protein
MRYLPNLILDEIFQLPIIKLLPNFLFGSNILINAFGILMNARDKCRRIKMHPQTVTIKMGNIYTECHVKSSFSCSLRIKKTIPRIGTEIAKMMINLLK